ncbi:MAG: sigma-54-dependent Fis family transcriptional regulator [Fibrobacteres bacterium]|nr:sigma-54-dependent Fis family transcriptional regulator [Fibrobacterota bacterium]
MNLSHLKTDEILNALLNGITDFRNTILLHDINGNVKEILTNPVFAPPPLYTEVNSQRTLAPFFDLTRLQKTTHSHEPVLLPGISNGRYGYYFDAIFSIVPMHYLWTKHIGDGLYVARITIRELFPFIQMGSGNGFFIVNNENETIDISTLKMANLLLDNNISPEKILGKPLQDLLSPSPLEYQKNNLSPFKIEDQNGYTTLLDEDYSKENIDGALTITAASDKASYLRFPVVIDTEKEDFIFSVTYTVVKGSGPYLTLGEKTYGETEPDLNGYMAGHYFETGSLVLKRYGFNIQQTKSPLGFTEGMLQTLTLSKVGRSIYLYINNSRVLSFFDDEFIAYKTAFVAFAVRSGSCCRIFNASIKVKSGTNIQLNSVQHVAELKSKPGVFYLISRFYSNALNQPQPHLMAGYQLLNTTMLQSAIKVMDTNRQVLEKQTKVLGSLLKKYQSGEDDPKGSSDAFVALRETARNVALSEAIVLIEGETGVGKEVFAHYIHRHSSRKNGPFIKVDCSTIPGTLIESQLFGHEKGAFTGAVARSIGMFERADGGTLFLDEVSNLPLDVQAKLLRFFNDYSIVRVGGDKAIQVNVRCLLASNKSLGEMTQTGTFRNDLFYRINVITLKIPPLRERLSDINELSQYFLAQFAHVDNKSTCVISPEAALKLQNHNWPGNVRELKNVIERAVVFAEGDTITPDLIRFGHEDGTAIKRRKRKPWGPFSLSQTKPAKVVALLKKHGGKVTSVASEMGVSRISLHIYLKKQGICAKDYRKGY